MSIDILGFTLMNRTGFQRVVERLRPYIGFTYPVLRCFVPSRVKMSLQASFLMTNRCNARCGFCMVAPYFDDPRKDLTLDKFKAIAKNIRLGQFYNICLSGGEPLLNPDTLPIIRFVNQHYPAVRIFLTTNGIALGDYAEELSRLDVPVLSVSVNAGSRKVYSETMGVDQFNNVVDNIIRYQQSGRRVSMSFVAHRRNIEDLPRFIHLAYDLAVPKVTVRYAKFYSHRHKMGDLQERDSLFYHQELSDEYFTAAGELSKRLGIELVTADDPLFGCDFPKRRCQFPHTDVLVGMDGEVFPCCGGEIVFKKKVDSGEYDFGNALKQPIKAWHHNRLWESARGMNLPECDICPIGIIWDGHLRKRHIMEW